MPKINVLPKNIAELIAAGEVIERPASVIKELVENSIDSGAKHITVEIKNGGITYMRVTDDGCGISADDVSKAFLRHATSKISRKEDLDKILTLGFRGEALASICAVSKIEMLTKRREDELGTHYCIEGGEETLCEETGCPDGTTIIIRDIFYNVPARQKFLKKDVTEANYIASAVHKQILSHPEVCIRLIKNNKQEVFSSGDSQLISAIFAVYGRSFANEMIEVAPYKSEGVTVSGYAVKPLSAKSSRGFQSFFVNGRYVRSATCSCALDEAYKNLIMTGKFPACVLNIEINPETVDVNVHPSKAEVRFSNEKLVFNAVYFAVKNALMLSGLHYNLDIEKAKKPIEQKLTPREDDAVQMKMEFHSPQAQISDCKSTNAFNSIFAQFEQPKTSNSAVTFDTQEKACEKQRTDVFEISEQSEIRRESDVKLSRVSPIIKIEDDSKEMIEQSSSGEAVSGFKYISELSFEKTAVPVAQADETEDIKVIGEAFKNYILAQCGDELIIIDKHAAHERIIFEKLKKSVSSGDAQLILQSSGVMLSFEEITALKDNIELVRKLGFDLDFSHEPMVYPTKIPMLLDRRDIDDIIPQMAQKLMHNSTNANPDIIDDILHTFACKSAVKQGDINDTAELEEIAKEVWSNNAIRHCPHGRPVMFIMPKSKIEKQFKRT